MAASPSTETGLDTDDVPNEVEAQVLGRAGSATGDGNGDGIPDAQQANVASLPAADGASYLTFATSADLRLAKVRATATTDTLPEGTSLPYGSFDFTIEGVVAGGSADVDVYLPESTSPAVTTYLKRTSTGAMEPFHWDGTSGNRLDEAGFVRLRIVDGGRGDADGLADGRIVDPGGPGVTSDPAPIARFTWKRASDHPWALLLDGSGSFDPAGMIDAVQWDFGDGDPGVTYSCPGGRCAEMGVQHEYKADSMYEVTLTVTDEAGNAGTSTTSIRVPEAFEVECTAKQPTSGPAPHGVAWEIDTSWDRPGDSPFGPTFPYQHLVREVRVDMGDGTTDKATFWESSWNYSWKKDGEWQMTSSFEIINPATDQVGIAASCGFTVNVQPMGLPARWVGTASTLFRMAYGTADWRIDVTAQDVVFTRIDETLGIANYEASGGTLRYTATGQVGDCTITGEGSEPLKPDPDELESASITLDTTSFDQPMYLALATVTFGDMLAMTCAGVAGPLPVPPAAGAWLKVVEWESASAPLGALRVQGNRSEDQGLSSQEWTWDLHPEW